MSMTGRSASCVTAIQSHNIRFDNNAPLPATGQDAMLDQLAGELNQLATLSASLHVITRVTLTGHSDARARGRSNLSLSLARAEAVRALLKKRGVDPDLLAVRGAGPLEPLEADPPRPHARPTVGSRSPSGSRNST